MHLMPWIRSGSYPWLILMLWVRQKILKSESRSMKNKNMCKLEIQVWVWPNRSLSKILVLSQSLEPQLSCKHSRLVTSTWSDSLVLDFIQLSSPVQRWSSFQSLTTTILNGFGLLRQPLHIKSSQTHKVTLWVEEQSLEFILKKTLKNS